MRSALVGALAASAVLLSKVNASCEDKSLSSLMTSFDCNTGEMLTTQCARWDEQRSKRADTKEHSFEACLLSRGCSSELASDSQFWLNNGCVDDIPTENELRKRATTSTTKKTSEKTSTTAAAATTTVASTEVTTTSASTTESSTSTTASTSATSTISTTGSTSSGSTTTTTGSTSLVCLATSMSPVTWCATTTSGAAAGTSCVTTSSPIVSCASGLICQTEAAGTVNCMKRDNTLTTSGLVVTIVFGVAVASLIGSLLFMCFSARKASRVMKAKRNSMFVASSHAAAANSEANLPLMQQAGPAGGQYGGSAYDDYAAAGPSSAAAAGGRRMPSSNYADVVGNSRGVGAGTPPVPKLHAGLVSTPGAGYDAAEDDISYQGSRR